MQVFQAFGEMRQIVAFSPSALYALASGNVPTPIREHFVAQPA